MPEAQKAVLGKSADSGWVVGKKVIGLLPVCSSLVRNHATIDSRSNKRESPKFTVSSHVESSSSNSYREEGLENEGQDADYQAANQL
jgi:hypothetical protein